MGCPTSGTPPSLVPSCQWRWQKCNNTHRRMSPSATGKPRPFLPPTVPPFSGDAPYCCGPPPSWHSPALGNAPRRMQPAWFRNAVCGGEGLATLLSSMTPLGSCYIVCPTPGFDPGGLQVLSVRRQTLWTPVSCCSALEVSRYF